MQLGVGGKDLRGVDRVAVLPRPNGHLNAHRLPLSAVLRVVVLLAATHDGLVDSRAAGRPVQ